MPEQISLENGAVLLIDPVPLSETVSIGIWVGIGSRDEHKGIHGYSHLTEHMLFKGTSKRTHYDIARTIDNLGGEINGATGKEFTYYYVNVAKEGFEVVCDILVDMFCNSGFTKREFERERAVILDEIDMTKDDPEEYVSDLFSQALWREHPFGIPVIETKEDVSSATLESVWRFYKSRYTPDRMVVSVCGKVDVDQITEEFTDLLSGNCRLDVINKERLKEREKPIAYPTKIVQERDIEQVYFICGTAAYSYSDSRKYSLSLLNTILGGSFSSRLFQRIREKEGLCYSISSSFLSYSDVGEFSMSFSSNTENMVHVLERINEEVIRLKRDGVGKDELEMAKQKFRGNYTLAKESNEWKMARMAMQYLLGSRLISYDEVLKAIDRVSLNDVIDTARDLLQAGNLCIASVGPPSHVSRISGYQFPF